MRILSEHYSDIIASRLGSLTLAFLKEHLHKNSRGTLVAGRGDRAVFLQLQLSCLIGPACRSSVGGIDPLMR